MSAGIGHNGGPAMDGGVAWRRHCWSVARAELLPHLPLEVIRMRVRRAREIGLDYRTYALARETSGRDIVAFLYSSNALGLLRPGDALPEERAARLRGVRNCARTLLAHAPLDAPRLAAALAAEEGIAFAGAAPAPGFWATWAEVRAGVLAALGGLPAGGVMLVGDAPGERAWCEAARLGSYLPAERYFAAGGA
jgi:hypothetical protein